MIIVFVLAAVIISVIFFIQAYNLKKLKDRCTVNVTATCVDIETKAAEFGRRNTHSQNATYSFYYNGQNYIGRNSVWTSAGFSGLYVKKNDVVDVFINPADPNHDVFDSFAKRELRSNILTGIVFLLALMPFVFMKIIFHFVLFNH